MPLNTFTKWMALLCGEERRFEEREFSVDVYGEGDAAYLVLEHEISQSPRTSDQYVLHPLPGANPLFQQVRFLAEYEFDLHAAMSRLAQAEYAEIEMNEIARFDSVEVARYRMREN